MGIIKEKDDYVLRVAVLTLFVFGLIGYILAVIKYPTELYTSKTLELMGNACMVASIIGFISVKENNKKDDFVLRVAILTLFVFGMIAYVLAVIKYPMELHISKTFELMGNGCMVAAIIGFISIKDKK